MSRIDCWTAHQIAIELLKTAGFVTDHVAMKTETVYMVHPAARPKLLRVSTHKFKGRLIGLNGVAAAITFSPKDHTHSHMNVRNKVLFGIGEYFLGQARTSEYRGPRGAWEETAKSESRT